MYMYYTRYRKPSRLRDSRVAGPRLDEGKVSYLEGSLVLIPGEIRYICNEL